MECLNNNCKEEVPRHSRFCVVCGADAGCPNVRAASRLEEVSALKTREHAAEADAIARGLATELKEFREAVNKSYATINRPLTKINELLSSDNELYSTFYQSVGSESRLPEDNEWDNIRGSVDSLLFPHYKEHIRFAALSIDRKGISGYGNFCIVLKEAAIENRATAFNENAVVFVKRYRIVAGDPLPLGYISIWKERASLAVAKFAMKLMPSMKFSDYASLLNSSSEKDSDFIEIHIYGPIHRRAIEYLSGPTPKSKADKVILNSISKKLNALNITLEVF